MSALGEKALQYAARGWFVFPLWPMQGGRCTCGDPECDQHGKHPRVKWGTKASCDAKKVAWFWRMWPDAGIGLSTGPSGLVVFDIDGQESIRQLTEIMGSEPIPRTLRASTGKGFHLFFTGEAPTSSSKGPGLDVRGGAGSYSSSKGYVVLAPSPHASGKTYAWDWDVPVAPCPDKMLAWARAQRKGTVPATVAVPGYVRPQEVAPLWLKGLRAEFGTWGPHNEAKMRSALACIPASCGRDDWLRVGMALNWTGWPCFHLWDEWSATCPEKYKSGNTLYVWNSFRVGEVTLLTLLDKARGCGWEWPPPEVKEPEQALEPTKEMNGQHVLGPAFAEASPDKPLIKLNEKHCVIGDIGGKCLVLSWVNSKVDSTVKVPSFQTFKSFSERYANQYLVVKGENSKGEPVDHVRQIGTEWLKSTKRRSYEGIDLVPNGPPLLEGGYLNLWSGFAVAPSPGNWPLMRQHVSEVLAGGDADAAAYIGRFAAWAVQHPDERAEVALVFRGGKGSGKGTFANALKRLFGQHGLQIYSSKHLVGNFNGHLRNCILLFADEAFWAGDKAGESVLKGMLTEPTLVIEQKGLDATPWRNRLHVIMAANADWVVPASHDERRYAMFDVSPDRVGDEAYFKALNAEMQGGGLAAMLHDLLTLDLGDWHPRKIVRTEALRQQKIRSMDPRWDWLEGLLQAGILPHWRDRPDLVANYALQQHVKEHMPGKPISPQAMGRWLRAIGCDGYRQSQGRFWSFPPLESMRKAFEKRFGAWRWETDAAVWQVRVDDNLSLPSPTQSHVSL